MSTLSHALKLTGLLSFAFIAILLIHTDLENQFQHTKDTMPEENYVNASSVPQLGSFRLARIKESEDVTNIHTEDASNKSMYACPVDSDCWRLQKLITEEWDERKPRAAIYILTLVNNRMMSTLPLTLQCLEANFLSKYSYPVIIFYETDFIPLISFIRNCTSLQVFFQEVQFKAPEFLHPPARTRLNNCHQKGAGYKHMCRFHAKVVYDLPIMRNLEYSLRLDAHSYIKTPVPYDLFLHARNNDIVYMYPSPAPNTRDCGELIWEAAQLYCKVKGIQPHFIEKVIDDKGVVMGFNNNFELSRMDLFTGKPYQNFIHYIDFLGGIYYYRWGDDPLKAIAVSIFVPENQTKQIDEFTYVHRFKTKALSKYVTN